MASMHTLISVTLLCSVFVSGQNQNITTSSFIRDPQTLVSSNGYFQMGFFSLANSRSRYLGIWYYLKDDNDALEVVWVANRNNPLNDSSGVLKISELGNLQLLDAQNKIFWSSDVNLGSNSTSKAQLQDTGNLVLLGNDTSSENVLWQSFDHPSNSILPQMKITIDKMDSNKDQISSWRSNLDPSNGTFFLGINPQNQLTEVFIWEDDEPYWRTGPWNGNNFIGVPHMRSVILDGFTLVENSEGKLSISFTVSNQSSLPHMVLNFNGTLVAKGWNHGTKKWEITWNSLESVCDIYGYCGPFGSCNPRNSPVCSCLKGFEPKNREEWNTGNWSNGCVRRTPLQCGSSGGTADGFQKLSHMKTPDDASWLSSNDEDDCGRQCLGKCDCSAYVYFDGIGCMTWNRSLIDTQEFSVNGVNLFIRLADAELGKASKTKVILVVLIILGTILLVAMFFLWIWMNRRKGRKSTSKQTSVHLNKSNPITDLQDLPLFTFEELVAATNDFQEANILGRGGFGPVYKGNLKDGQEIAIKRLAQTSRQGLQEFMTEVVVISKLQHVNLVRLLGCCVERDEKMLIYEYMPNKSLSALLFDPLEKQNLDWKKRFNIIEGICRGLLYLHRDSRLRIIHRDLKASNILLDRELNPKISDFGMAKIFGRNEDQANTLRIVGTYGYMSPEYAMNGHFSEKSDVYSFGVLLLVIISGKSINSYNDYECLGLIGYAWKLWNEENVLALIDARISDPRFQMDILRCIQLALLCIQELPEERPTVSNIISMLDCEIADLPRPKQPGFTQRRNLMHNEFYENDQQDHPSTNNVSLTSIGAR